MNLIVISDPRETRNVPCGTCNECCRGDAIFIHPECGDDAALYKTEPYKGRVILQHQPNGDGIYLDRSKGCTIHATRPTICRELDCRTIVGSFSKRDIEEMGMTRIAYAARRLIKNGVGSSCD